MIRGQKSCRRIIYLVQFCFVFMYILLQYTYLFLRTKIIEKWQMDILSRLYSIVADSYFIIHCAYYNKCKKTQDYVVIFIKEFTELKKIYLFLFLFGYVTLCAMQQLMFSEVNLAQCITIRIFFKKSFFQLLVPQLLEFPCVSYCLTAREFDPVKIVYPFELEANPLSNFYP